MQGVERTAATFRECAMIHRIAVVGFAVAAIFFVSTLLGCAVTADVNNDHDVNESSQSFEATLEGSTNSAYADDGQRIIDDLGSLPAEAIVSKDQLKDIDVNDCFTVSEIDDDVFDRMRGNTYSSDCPVSRSDLRYLRLLHVDQYGNIKVGEMVTHREIAEDIRDIFLNLYLEGYPIERIRLADDYAGDDETSMENNNTSCFNCRPIEGTGTMSLHGYGLAVDVNTLYNPYYLNGSDVVLPTTGREYLDRTNVLPYTIVENDLCCTLFWEHGFTWGGDWRNVKDYQHFEKDIR